MPTHTAGRDLRAQEMDAQCETLTRIVQTVATSLENVNYKGIHVLPPRV